MIRHLFLASTPFNVVTAAMVALTLPENSKADLWLIDQPKDLSPFVRVLPGWVMSPFSDVRVMSYKASNIRERIGRKTTLRRMEDEFHRLTPQHLYTGNDRRIEFQWLMGHSSGLVTGHYLDDGTYTYIGRKTHWLADRVFDQLFKKLAYGLWWKQPSTIGASDWITNAHVAFPDSVVPELCSKNLHQLPDNLSHPAFTQLMSLFNLPAEKLNKADTLVLIPHQSAQDETTLAALHQAAKAGQNVLVKNHPRNSSIPQELANHEELPASLPMEALLPGLSGSCRIYGDVSTALLTSKWLRPELQVIAFTKDKNHLIPLMSKLGISVTQVETNQ